MKQGLGIQVLDPPVCMVDDVNTVDLKNPSVSLYKGLMELDEVDITKNYDLIFQRVDLESKRYDSISANRLIDIVKKHKNLANEFFISVVKENKK